MITRSSIFAGQFYPRNENSLRNTIEKFGGGINSEKKDIVGCVVPHAGYIYSGSVQTKVFKSIGNDDPIFVILGPNHGGLGPIASIMTSGEWKTPLGNASINTTLAEKVLNGSKILEKDMTAHDQEHSIEVQLPWLQYFFENVDFVPICLNTGMMDSTGFEDIGKSIKESTEGIERDVVVIASSDFTHYGERYGYTPVDGPVEKRLNFIEKVDREVAGKIVNLDSEGFLEIINKYRATICGYGPIATMLHSLRGVAGMGEIEEYTTSYEVSGDVSSIVGYCGITIPRK
ncbi:MAG: AmmeMemoRadiSam system protein B [Candidatus Aenigmatarchaeota archaeon]